MNRLSKTLLRIVIPEKKEVVVIRAGLFDKYSGEKPLFKYMGDVPTPDEAVNFFNKLGIDGSALQAMLINQHNNCGDNRDFVHECVMYAV